MNPVAPTYDLDSVLPDYPKLVDAPSKSVLEAFATSSEHLDKLIETERARRYKTVDRRGRVFLVANPAVLKTVTAHDGTTYVIRPAPKHVMTFEKSPKGKIEIRSVGSEGVN